MADRVRCVPLVDDDGQVVASVRVAGELDEESRGHLLNIVKAALRREAELDAADPWRAARQEAAAERIRERNRRWRGEQP
ncbi:hypothetical protein AB0K35_28410 [Micromonospora sp. NPDC053740]|uniref:hypothetical protein n=1 Tax=Micromonospora sp. NPDC053740 TaxID=3155173 RepID=UPI003419204C